MDCSICHTLFSSRGQPTCASCARALIYKARLSHLTDLLAKDASHERVASVIAPPSEIQSDPPVPVSGPDLIDITESGAKHRHGLILAEAAATKARYALAEQQLGLLKRQIEDAKISQASRREAHERRRIDLASEKESLETRMPLLLDPLQTSIKHLHRKIDKIHFRTREGRVKLCHETARLAGLQQRKRHRSNGQVVEDYMIGGVLIPDLRHLCTARPDQISAAMANICRLLITTCHYLSVRLPAEINPARANHPHPTMFSVQSSYMDFQINHPGSSSHNPSASRLLDNRSLPKLRLLHLDKPLVRLARDDYTSYNLFVEGVALLAWDVAWLCRSQGLSIANSLDEVCALGRNLCLLYRENVAVNDRGLLPEEKEGQPRPSPTFGELSHAAVETNIEAPIGIAHMRSWRFVSPHRLIDGLKSHLLTEMSGAEWELLHSSEWDLEREDEQAVLVGGSRPADPSTVAASTATVANESTENMPKEKGSNGWMKLKSRGNEAI